ncbi:MAG: hypothetical protein EPN85_08085 [Bacteroidetes bacterium]|nr:MAG: hypothetical protein EPN85_08085 [Bacteroidota bacterium]
MELADGFGNYLYIIFAVVYVIYSIVKAGKKVTQNRPTIDKKPHPSPTVQPPTASPLPENNSGDELKKMLEDLLGGGAEDEIPEKQILKPKPQVVYEKPPPVKMQPPVPRKEKLATYQTQAKPKVTSPAPAFVAHPEIVQKVFMERVPEEESGIDFDIRQAVIYSEILKRPQY